MCMILCEEESWMQIYGIIIRFKDPRSDFDPSVRVWVALLSCDRTNTNH